MPAAVTAGPIDGDDPKLAAVHAFMRKRPVDLLPKLAATGPLARMLERFRPRLASAPFGRRMAAVGHKRAVRVERGPAGAGAELRHAFALPPGGSRFLAPAFFAAGRRRARGAGSTGITGGAAALSAASISAAANIS